MAALRQYGEEIPRSSNSRFIDCWIGRWLDRFSDQKSAGSFRRRLDGGELRFNLRVGILRRILGFALGFAGLMLFLLVFNTLANGVILPVSFIGIVALLFIWHPRLGRSRSTAWLLATFALVGLGVWMLGAPPVPVPFFQRVAAPVPFCMFSLGAATLTLFFYRNRATESEQRLNVFCSIIFLLLAWTVFRFSGDEGGADGMVRFAMETFGLSYRQAEVLIIVVRKAVHFFGYGVVALNAFYLADPRCNHRQAAIFGLAIALTMGIFDEWSQSAATNRSASPWDVGLDMLGAASFVSVSVLRYRRRLQPSAPADRLPY